MITEQGCIYLDEVFDQGCKWGRVLNDEIQYIKAKYKQYKSQEKAKQANPPKLQTP